jgi:hypothetical protein
MQSESHDWRGFEWFLEKKRTPPLYIPSFYIYISKGGEGGVYI